MRLHEMNNISLSLLFAVITLNVDTCRNCVCNEFDVRMEKYLTFRDVTENSSDSV